MIAGPALCSFTAMPIFIFAAAGPVVLLPLGGDGSEERGVRRYLKVTDFEDGQGNNLGGAAITRPVLLQVKV